MKNNKSKTSCNRGFTKDVILNLFQDLHLFKNANKAGMLKRVHHDNRRRGFTLIELLVVVLIIGILAAVALPQYRKVVELNEAKMMLANMHAIKKAEKIYYLANGRYTQNWEELDVGLTAKSLDGKNLFTPENILYSLDTSDEQPNIYASGRGRLFALYFRLDRPIQLCYPRGTEKGKRVCGYLGCPQNQLDDSFCFFTWEP